MYTDQPTLVSFCFVRASVVQATKSARWSAIQWYMGIGFAILFFGGFLVKSYWEEHVFERDTRKLLAYYKHVIPGSVSDGDLQASSRDCVGMCCFVLVFFVSCLSFQKNARYLVWKYRYKKQNLWKNLEKKYGEPVLEENEWDDRDDEGEGSAPSDDHEDLDEDTAETMKEEQDL
jgi:hypothetical protein